MKSRKFQAFTLIELLVAVTVLSLMMLILFGMVSSISKLWTAESKKAEVLEVGRAVLNQIARDLGPATVGGRSEGAATPSIANISYLQFVQNPPLPSSVPVTPGTDWLFWQAPLVRTNGSQDPLAVVGYFMTTNTQGTGPMRTLNRYYAECPAPTGSSAVPMSSTTYNLYASQPDRTVPFLNSGSISATSFDPWNTSSGASILSENVLGIWFRCRDCNGKPIGAAVTSTNGVYSDVRDPSSITFNSTKIKYDSSWAAVRNRLPASVEVTLVCIDSKSLTRLTNVLLPVLTDPNNPADLSEGTTDPYQTTIDAFVQAVRNVTGMKGAEIRSFTNIIPLKNGTYVNEK